MIFERKESILRNNLYFCSQETNKSHYMNNIKHKYIAVAYELFAIADGERHMAEKTEAGKPFDFISGFGLTLEDFENAVVNLAQGDEFDLTLTPAQAYGEYVQERVLDLDKEIFCIDGKFDHEHIRKDSIIPLQNEEGQRFMAQVVEIGDNKVKVDLNHPLAGKSLNFKGTVVEMREATEEEVSKLIKQLSGGCGGCGGCGGSCGEGGCGEGNCGEGGCKK